MTSTLDDARGELLALADALAAQLKHTGGPLFLTTSTVNEIIAALRAAPVPQRDAEPPFLTGEVLRQSLRGSECLAAESAVTGRSEEETLDRLIEIAELAKIHWRATPPSRSDAESREVLIHTICPHIKVWSDGEDVVDMTCKKCPATVETSQGTGVQMCRLNAEKAADSVLALVSPPSEAGREAPALAKMLREVNPELADVLTDNAAYVQAIWKNVIEECAKHLESQAELLTNSLHCGDSSMEISRTHQRARNMRADAKLIRALSRPDQGTVGGSSKSEPR